MRMFFQKKIGEKKIASGKWKRRFAYMFSAMFLFFLSLLIFGYIYIAQDLPSVEEIQKMTFSESTVLLDRKGNELYTIHGDENRKLLPLTDIPTSLIHAVLAIEDDDFFHHPGFDYKAILRSAIENIFNLTSSRKKGGSTITQQFVKNTFLTPEQTYRRKIKELILSLRVEQNFSKEEILEMYLNRVSFGGNAYGAALAVEQFFAKDVQDLTLAESVVLSALLKSPTYYSPYGDHTYTVLQQSAEELLESQSSSAEELQQEFEASYQLGLLGKKVQTGAGEVILSGRANIVLSRMKELEYITEREFLDAEEELLMLKFQRSRENILAPHFVMYIRKLLEEQYGKEYLEQGGLRVTTTLDPLLQKEAEASVEKQRQKNTDQYEVKNAALLSVSPKTGQILAMVGSADYWDETIDGNVNILLQKRLPGSSFKPFAYAAAFMAGYAPSTVVFDVETEFGEGYTPQNFDGAFRGPVSLRHALGNSLNIPALKAGYLGGIENVYNLAQKMGIQFTRAHDWYGIALSLGAGEVRAIDLAQAYMVFARNGTKISMTPFLKIEDRKGNILFEWEDPQEETVLVPEIAALVTDVLADPKARGEGWNSYLQLKGRQNASKTGTSNKKKKDIVYPFDGWTVGFTPSLLTVVWAGNADGRVMNVRGSGFVTAAPIWKDFMEKALKGTPKESFERPSTLKRISVTKTTGLLPPENFPKELITADLFAPHNAVTKYDTSLEPLVIDSVSGKLVTEDTPEVSRKKVFVVRWRSKNPRHKKWEEGVNNWVEKNGKEWFLKHREEDILIHAPTEYDDVHTKIMAQKSPKITLLAPIAHGVVTPSFITVVPDIEAFHGVEKVEFFWDGKLKYTKKSAPFIGRVRISTAETSGKSHQVLVRVSDRLGYSESASVQVKIGKDTEPPVVSIRSPRNLTSAKSGKVAVFAYDAQSEVRLVEVFVNGSFRRKTSELPYEFSLPLPKKSFELLIRATDRYGHSSEEKIIIE